MDKKHRLAVIGTVVTLILLITVIAVGVIKHFTPSDKVMELTDYYPIENGEVLFIMQTSKYDKKGIMEDGTIYIDYQTVIERFNKRFYWDAYENVLIYTTPTELIRAELGDKEYYVNKSEVTTDYQIVKVKGDEVYIALEFVKQYSDLTYSYYQNPDRVVIQYMWDEYLVSTVKKSAELRVLPNIKSDILVELEQDQKLTYIDTSEVPGKGFVKVITEDGIIGYVKSKFLTESQYEAIESDYIAPIYTQIKNEGTINLVWHQVTNPDANEGLVGLIEDTKGVTTVSPTWFKVDSVEGTISSLADETYVEKAHSLGLDVWALVDDFNTDISMLELLSRSSRREKLINNLLAAVIQYNLDGINIDFENITAEAGTHFIQFLRELSIKCRNNNIVLSIDNYVPMPYNAYYDRKEQGIIADYLIIMAYDEHHGKSVESGSVSSIGFVENAIKNTLEMAPKEKVIIALPFYTRQWKEVTDSNGNVTVTSSAYGMSTAEGFLTDNNAERVWDEKTGQYYGEYQLDDATYKIWLEEDESMELKMKQVKAAGVAGVAFWKLGLEKDSIWNVIIKYLN